MEEIAYNCVFFQAQFFFLDNFSCHFKGIQQLKLLKVAAADKYIVLKKPFSQPTDLQFLQGDYQVQLTFFP